MKKILFSYLIPTITILPLTMISCSSFNNDEEVKKIKAKISEIIKLAPLPTLETPPISSIDLVDYYSPGLYVDPQSPETGFTITVDSIELPILNWKNLIIWLKIDFDNPNIYDKPEISELYSIEFTKIKSVEGKVINPIPKEELEQYFENKIRSKEENFEKLIRNAFYGEGYFDNQLEITPGQEEEKFKERLTSANINKLVFNDLQNNIGLEYISGDFQDLLFRFNVFLGETQDNILREIVIDLRGK